MLDFTSLLIAVCFSATCLSATLLAAWFASRTDGFLFTCAVGALLIAVGVCASALYIATPAAFLGLVAFALMLAGLAALYGAAWQFRHGAVPNRAIAAAGLASLGLALPPHVFGYNGVGFILGYLASALLLAGTAFHYWRAREESPVTLVAVAGLYLLIAISFLPRAGIVILEGKAIIPGQPRNWAEDLSLLFVIASIPGIGAMTMVLNQKRLLRIHKREAMTDSLTGLLNRRALFEAYEGALKVPVAAVLFDIDHFKTINDTYGHAVGDSVIGLFARALQESAAPSQSAARLGGDEFALILPEASPDAARQHAERVCLRFSDLVAEVKGLACTASAGISHIKASGIDLDGVLHLADLALYEAKDRGRGRVVAAGAAGGTTSSGPT